MMTLLCGPQGGLEFMLAYLAFVHTPMHCFHCWFRRRWVALACAAVATVFAALVVSQTKGVIVGDGVQRLVISHIVCEFHTEKN